MMATRLSLSMTGMREYLERVARANRDIDDIVDEALLAGAQVLLVGMQKRVRYKTGNLQRKLVIVGPVRDGNFHFVFVGLPDNVDAETARYGNVHEFGSSSVQAQSYVRTTMKKDGSKANKAMRNKISSEMSW